MQKTVVIIEDEVIIAENLNRILTKFGYEVLYIANTFEEGLEAVKDYTPFAFLIDINLSSPFGDGITIAKKIKHYSSAKHIYVTANADKNTLIEASSSFPDGYITKPFRADQIFSALEILYNNSQPIQHIEVKHKGNLIRLEENQIHFIKSDGVYVEIYTEFEKYLFRASFNNLLKKFANSLIQVHRSYLINKHKVNSYNSKEVELICGTDIPIGRIYRQDFVQSIKSI